MIFERLVGQPVGEVFARAAELQVRHVAELAVGGAARIGEKEGVGRARLRAADVDVETVRFGVVRGVAQVPLAHQGRQVTGRLQVLGDRGFRVRQVGDRDRRHEAAIAGRVQRRFPPDGHMQPRRAFAGHQARPGGRANRRRGIGVGEPHALPGEAVEVGASRARCSHSRPGPTSPDRRPARRRYSVPGEIPHRRLVAPSLPTRRERRGQGRRRRFSAAAQLVKRFWGDSAPNGNRRTWPHLSWGWLTHGPPARCSSVVIRDEAGRRPPAEYLSSPVRSQRLPQSTSRRRRFEPPCDGVRQVVLARSGRKAVMAERSDLRRMAKQRRFFAALRNDRVEGLATKPCHTHTTQRSQCLP